MGIVPGFGNLSNAVMAGSFTVASAFSMTNAGLPMPGTVIVREHVVREMMIDVMLGLWNDGFRKQLIVNNHGQLWMLESAVQEFQKRYQLPGVFRVIDSHRGVREFFRPVDRGGQMGTNFVHADESETSLGLLLHPEMVDMD